MWFYLIIYLILELINYIYFLKIKNNILKKEYYYGNRFDSKMRNNFLNTENKIKYVSDHIEFHKINNISLSNIPLDSFIDFFLSTYYNKSREQAEIKHLSLVYKDIQNFQKKYKINLTDKNDNIFKTFGKTDIYCIYKPIPITILFYSVKFLSELKLKLNGFKKYYSPKTNICYWYKIKKDSKSDPLMFFHGLGIGIIPYLNFIIEMSNNITVICPVLPNISNVYFHPLKFNLCNNDFFPNFSLIKNEIDQILSLHKINSINIIGHSFGTFILSSLLLSSSLRHRIKEKIFIDPVCFHSNLVKVLKSVDIKKDDDGSLKPKILHYFIYLDIYVKYALNRNLFSMEFLWGDFEYFDENTMIILSEKDTIVPSEDIYEDMYNDGYVDKIEWLENALHGDIFTTNNWNETLNKIKKKLL
jgi:hypothetical protein